MRKVLGGAVIAILANSAAAEGPFDGLWRSNPTTDCVYAENDGGALKIEDDVLFGAESQCEMTVPVNVRDMDAVLYDMECSGDDRNWTDRAMFLSAADGGLYLIWNGYAFKYDRCDDDAAVGTVVTAGELGITGDANAASGGGGESETETETEAD